MKLRLGFKQKLLCATWLLVVMTVVLSGYMAYRQQAAVTDSLVGDWIATGLAKDATLVQSTFAQRMAGLERFTQAYRAEPLPGGRDHLIGLAQMLANLTDLDSAVIALDTGEAYWNQESAEWPGHQYDGDVRQLAWYQFARQARVPSLSDPFQDEGVTYISVVQAISNGVITLDFDTHFMQAMVARVTEDRPGMMAAIVTDSGYVLASSLQGLPADRPLSEAAPALRRWLSDLAEGEPMHRLSFDGAERLLAGRRLQLANQSYTLVLAVDPQRMFHHLQASERNAILTTLAVTLAAMGFYFLLLQLTYRPVIGLKEMILSLAQGEGDLTRRLEVKGNDDLAQMGQGINEFIGQLQQMMADVAAVAHRLKAQSAQLSGHSHHSAGILARHAAETDQVLAAVEQMSVTADNVAQDAGETAGYTREADDQGQRCSGMTTEASSSLRGLVAEVEQSAASVQSMTDETRSITQVLTVIGEIAEQTNLLALNAAIEAARAGEQGRGFAVVADEVRALASRTQSSTCEIAQALERLRGNNSRVVQAICATKASVTAVADNAGSVGEGIDSLSHHLSQVTGLSARIATAAEEQSSVTREISRNMTAIREMVTELGHSGDEVVQRSQEVDQASQRLTTMVARFTL
ncbi:methyl-accepting chemotaxis protein [Ferrimonas futtsuensis]|uniref:methyl-accepting chemotaxis protein n=1 Tax=Ferrimonas futtsuensis TaxID=364764 RepID=UPI0003FE30BE|nr:methyl-accepting chemotaxis protein [Ferrimonas futtsuensis]